MDPLIQQAYNLFSSIIGTSAENLVLFVFGNENIVSVRTLTRQYVKDVANALGVTPPGAV